MQYRSPHIEVYHRFQVFVIFTIIVCNFDTDRIIDELGSIVAEKKIIPGRTLVFFDEIQDCPRAIQSLKYFCENMPKLHLIAEGSLLGVSIRKEGVSFPVGKIDRREMYPMSFEEFKGTDAEGNEIDENYMCMFRVKGMWEWNDVPADISQYYKGKIAYICEYDG